MNKRKWLFVIGIPVVCAVLMTVVLLALYKEVVIVNGMQQVRVQGFFVKTEGALRKSGMAFDDGDAIFPALNETISNGDVISIETGAIYVIEFEDETSQVKTTSRNLIEVLLMGGITPTHSQNFYVDGVKVDLNAEMEADSFHTIEVFSPITFSVDDEGIIKQVVSAGQSVLEILEDGGIVILEGDLTEPGLLSSVTSEEIIFITRAREIRIQVDNKVMVTRTNALTVGEALTNAGVALQGMDFAKPDEKAPLPEDNLIQVVRVTDEVIIEQESIPFEIDEQILYEVPLDSYQVVQAGQPGIQANRVRIRYEDGVEISRNAEETWIAQEPINRVGGYGYLAQAQTKETPHGTIEFYRAMEFRITAYNVDKTSVGQPWHGYVFCNNMKFEPGFVGADLDYLPCGTRLYIEGFGFATVMDTDDGAIHGAWVDIGYFDADFKAWHEDGMVYFLTPIPSSYPVTIPPGSFNQ